MPKLSYIIPCYFNEKNIPVTCSVLIENEKLFPENLDFEYVFIDDGSKDNTLEELIRFKNSYSNKVKVIKLSGNFGSHNAIMAGMNYASGDCNVILAADLQDPPEEIPKMYDYWSKGIKLVIANRMDREENFLQKKLSNTYHALIKKYAIHNIPKGGFDMVLFDKQLRDLAVKINEKNTNQLYLLAWMKFDYVNIPYIRRKREIGKSRWTLKKKIKLFIDSFVSFSYAPLKFISVTGMLLGLAALIYGGYIIYAKLSGLIPIEGWSTLMIVFLFVASFQMIALGIIGEYVWRTLDAARNRPQFIIDKIY